MINAIAINRKDLFILFFLRLGTIKFFRKTVLYSVIFNRRDKSKKAFSFPVWKGITEVLSFALTGDSQGNKNVKMWKRMRFHVFMWFLQTACGKGK